MKKILLIGTNERSHTIARIIARLKNNGAPFEFVKWRSLAFKDGHVASFGKSLNFKKYRSAFIDAPNFNVVYDKKRGGKISFRLANEMHALIRKLKANNVFVINGDFMREYPYYNKFTQSQIYSEKKIPTISTIHVVDNEFEKVLEIFKTNSLRFPVVAKLSHGGKGEQVWKIKNKQELEIFLEKHRNANLIYQPYIENDGDYRVLVIGGKSLGVMKRVAKKGEWKNNFALGGSVERYTDKKMERFVEKTCKKIGLDYAGVDVFKLGKQYVIIEINIFACFEGFEATYPETNIGEKIFNCLNK